MQAGNGIQAIKFGFSTHLPDFANKITNTFEERKQIYEEIQMRSLRIHL